MGYPSPTCGNDGRARFEFPAQRADITQTGAHRTARGSSLDVVSETDESRLKSMVALLALVLILAIFGGLGFAAHVLWIVLIFAVLLWLIGFFIGGVEGGPRRWYGRW
jgi:hypothetical protein